jgi:hypothetical protein
VHVADILARALGAGWWGDDVMPHLDAAARHTLHLEPDDAQRLLEQLDEAYPRAAATFGGIFTPLMVGDAAPLAGIAAKQA